MIFNVQDDVITEMVKLAILASPPNKREWLKRENIKVNIAGDKIDVRFYQGRAVYIKAFRHPNGWKISSQPLDVKYQSWAIEYSSWSSLLFKAKMNLEGANMDNKEKPADELFPKTEVKDIFPKPEIMEKKEVKVAPDFMDLFKKKEDGKTS